MRAHAVAIGEMRAAVLGIVRDMVRTRRAAGSLGSLMAVANLLANLSERDEARRLYTEVFGGCTADARTCRVGATVRACVRASGVGRPRIRAELSERLPSALDRVWLGSQAFGGASAFNANIGVWNTARVTDLTRVCVASGPAARTAARTAHCGGRARPLSDAARPLCAAAPPMHAHSCVGTRLRGRQRGYCTAARRKDQIYVHEYIRICIYYIYI